MVFTGWDAQKPVAVAEVGVGKAAFFGAEKKGDAAGREAFADEGSGLRQAFHGVLWAATSEGSGAYDESTVGDGFRDGFEFFSASEKGRSSDGGTSFAESKFVGIDDAEVGETEVAHGAAGGANVERVARGNKNDTETVELG
ncbi:MAG TPA: hypothetical protein VHM88_13730 [Candidatus Acidoferrales bacterium]|nr:hypothetical protein [Candidatus Acidoferrales bacterium]